MYKYKQCYFPINIHRWALMRVVIIQWVVLFISRTDVKFSALAVKNTTELINKTEQSQTMTKKINKTKREPLNRKYIIDSSYYEIIILGCTDGLQAWAIKQKLQCF